jgi:leucyl-tRNA synthetase
VSTADPAFYKWTQWAVIQLFHHWFDEAAGKTLPIAELVRRFEERGTGGLRATCTKPLAFTAAEWRAMAPKAKDDVLLNYRMVYLSEGVVNWCPALGTVLANDEVAGGYSVRGNHPVEQKKMQQWALRVTAYAERLLRGLDTLDWPESVVETQRNWIGRSEGAQVFFAVDGRGEKIEVFTTRPDTIFGATFLVLAPEHPLAQTLTTAGQNAAVQAYLDKVKLVSERERLADVNRVGGVFTGSHAVHPFTKKPVPIWLSDYVIASYGTGAIMAVPAHDGRDHGFAKHFKLPIVEVVKGDGDVQEAAHEAKAGTLVSSGFLDGLDVPQAIATAIQEIQKAGLGRGVVQYRLRDAIFSRQRYWGEPFPVYYQDGQPRTLPESTLPLTLPAVDKYLPTETGEPPLGRAKDWQTADGFPLDLNTMPGFAGSSAYFLRYMDPHNDRELLSKAARDYWQDVDLYVGGREHATGHLIYARFWNLFLYDLGVAARPEPFKKLVNQGMITGRSSFVYRVKGENRFISKGLIDRYDTVPVHVDVSLVKDDKLDLEGFKRWRPDFNNATFELEDGKYLCGWAIEKMSKSYFNVVNPDDVVRDYGADTLRLYEMFLGPLDQSKPWQSDGIEGVHRFLKRLANLLVDDDGQLKVSDAPPADEEQRLIHPLIKKVREDLTSMSMNTAISAFMIALNGVTKLEGGISRQGAEAFLRCLAPFAPHLAEELWERLGHKTFVIDAAFPEFEERFVTAQTVTLPVSVNGKKRLVLDLPVGYDEAKVKDVVMGDARVTKLLEGKSIRKIIYVEGRMLNIVI